MGISPKTRLFSTPAASPRPAPRDARHPDPLNQTAGPTPTLASVALPTPGQDRKRRRILPAGKILAQRRDKDRVGRRHLQKERETGTQLLRVDVTEYPLGTQPVMRIECRHTFPQPSSKNRMREIRLRFRQ